MIWRYISALHRSHQRYLSRVMQPLGITASEITFVVCLCKIGSGSQRQLSRELSVDEALTVRAIKSLEQKGIVSRHRSETDRRQYEVALTPLGESLRPQVFASIREWGSELLSGFSEEEVQALSGMLETMYRRAGETLQRTT